MIDEILSMRRVPDGQMKYAPMFAEWSRLELPLGNPKYEPGGELGASGLAGCIRKLGYKLTGVEGEPFDEEALHAMGIGTLIHLAIQAVAKHTDPERYIIEDHWQLPGHDMGSHADIHDLGEPLEFFDIADAPPEMPDSEVVDIKSLGSYAFKMKSKEGPQLSHVLQTTAGAMALGANKCRIVYIATTKMTGWDLPDGVEKGDRATIWQEWVWDTEDAAHLVEAEMQVIAKVRRITKSGELPPRTIPSQMEKGARIEDVGIPGDKNAKGAWALRGKNGEGETVLLDSGEVWQCAYCEYQTVCGNDLKEGK
jgi:hypothetical protein